MNQGLVAFYPRLTSVAQPTEVSVRGWSAKHKAEVVAEARPFGEIAPMGGQALGTTATESAFGGAANVVTAWPPATQAEADQIARAQLEDAALNYVTGEGVCWGRTDLHAGTVIGIDGIGSRFSGPYYVTGVSHQYTSRHGYQTHFRVRRNAS
jgi:phage protein D